jgi:phosphoribosylglycinamide formyltransferase-1
MLTIGVLASGTGTNLQAIIDACNSGDVNARVGVVVSNNENAYALKRAQQHDLNARFIDSSDTQQHEQEIQSTFEEHDVDLAVGAGYMRILSPNFIQAWYGRLINIHPALLPSFKGTDGQGDALRYGVKISGCTTHFMDEKADHGPIILQAAVRVYDDDSRNDLAERILQVEHQLLPRSIDLYEQERLYIEGRRVHIAPGDSWQDRGIPNVLYPDGF